MDRTRMIEMDAWNYALYEQPDGSLILEADCHVAGAFYSVEYKLKKKEKSEYTRRTKRMKTSYLNQLARKARRGAASA